MPKAKHAAARAMALEANHKYDTEVLCNPRSMAISNYIPGQHSITTRGYPPLNALSLMRKL